MTNIVSFDDLVGNVLTSARDFTPRHAIEFGVIHGFCRDFAETQAPGYIDLLSRVEGLQALLPALERRPDLVVPATPEKALWYFVRNGL
ncbi:hypothetical protein [Neorhizobium sp. NCHU2750]|uniref:hypothetical protein n=1 Tax=Neorhizobium sp. NCHU2750 TaxID=1825976 RepID=UPI000E7076C4|nr:hypothetical protein NCHU2750_25900 [Neorhizobium sp. NCHU2750]